MKKRCSWTESSKLMRQYHDREWGVPQRDDKILFEYIVLDSFQAGLSWAIILQKRENFRKAFAEFDPIKIARFDKRKIESLLRDQGIVRNRGKIEACLGNAKTFLEIISGIKWGIGYTKIAGRLSRKFLPPQRIPIA